MGMNREPALKRLRRKAEILRMDMKARGNPQYHDVNEMLSLIDIIERQFKLEQHSDEDLLIELRRRGRLARVEAENIAPEVYGSVSVPIEYQIERAWRDATKEAARLHIFGRKPTGEKIEMVSKAAAYPYADFRRVRFALNYVVDK